MQAHLIARLSAMLVVMLTAALLSLHAAGTALPVQDPAAHTLADIAWLTGHWRGGGDEGLHEEMWTDARAGSMTGLFRWFRGERLIVHELLLLEEVEGRVEMRLRHFGAGMRAWEDEPQVFVLTELNEQRAVFEQQNAEHATTLAYERPTDVGMMRFTFLQKRPDQDRRFVLEFWKQ